ncbi:MAG TPA: hypothetical protein VMT89_17035, partial [Candidatus Acidoferrales bacterium]|nr:hypothetical protein [Candidatus Acidoferrales bacterium]
MSSAAPRRVALVIGQLTRGGAEGQLVQVALRLDRRRFDPYVYCLSSQCEPHAGPLREAGVPLRIVSGNAVQRLVELARWLDCDGIGLIHSWLFLANAAAALAHLRRPWRPLITSARNRKINSKTNQLA